MGDGQALRSVRNYSEYAINLHIRAAHGGPFRCLHCGETEATARAYARRNQPAPIAAWEVPELRQRALGAGGDLEARDVDDDEDEDDDEDGPGNSPPVPPAPRYAPRGDRDRRLTHTPEPEAQLYLTAPALDAPYTPQSAGVAFCS